MSTNTIRDPEVLGTISRTRIAVPMRDGVALAADVYAVGPGGLADLPAMPVLLERTPYGIRSLRSSDGLHADGSAVTPESGAEFFVREGYVVVRQDCRGRGDSEGSFTKYVGEADDGVDTHAWLLRQPWCDGRIFTAGVSYSAHTQAASASAGAPGVAAMILDSGGFASAYESGGRFGGAFELKQITWAHRHALASRPAQDDPTLAANLRGQDLRAWFGSMPWQPGLSPLAAAPEYEDFVFTQWSHEDLDEYWTQPGMYARAFHDRFPEAPSLHIASWYDPYVQSAVENFRVLGSLKASPSFLVLGPWTHGARSSTSSGDVDFGPDATLDGNLAADYLHFKAQFFRDAQQAGTGPAPTRPRVSYFLMGGGSGGRNEAGRLDHGGHWCFDSQWPPSAAEAFTLHLGDGQRLGPETATGDPVVAYDFDPRHPVPSIGGAITSGEPLMHGGAFDQTPTASTYPEGPLIPLAARPDVLTFRTPVLDEEVAVAGPVVVRLRISSTAPDTDFAVKLVDEYPATPDYPRGYAMNLTDGMLRCRYRDGFFQAVLMQPGEVYDIEIVLPDVANRFLPGHRIRVDVTSSNFPRCDVNPNTGHRVVGDRTRQVARNTVHLGGSSVTMMRLPTEHALDPAPAGHHTPLGQNT